MAANSDQFPPQVADLIARGKLIDAIKLLRQAKGLGLADAKAAIDAARARAGLMVDAPKAPPAAARHGDGRSPFHSSRHGLAPGEVPRGSEWPVLVALIVLVIVGWLAFR